MGRGFSVHGRQRAGVGGRPDRARVLAELAGFRRLRAGGGLALRPLGNADGRDGRRGDPRCSPGAHGPGDVARAVLSVLRRSRRRGHRRHAHSIDDDRDAVVRAVARYGDGGAKRRWTGEPVALYPLNAWLIAVLGWRMALLDLHTQVAPCADVPRPGGKPRPSGAMLTSQAATSAGVARGIGYCVVRLWHDHEGRTGRALGAPPPGRAG